MKKQMIVWCIFSQLIAVQPLFANLRNASDIDLSQLTLQQGIRLTGASGSTAGYSVKTAGDINGDGISDFLVGAPYDTASQSQYTRCYVIYGKKGGYLSNIDLSNLGSSDGFSVLSHIGEAVGFAVSGVGDTNGDGIDDFVVGAPNYALAYVIYGKKGGYQQDIVLEQLSPDIGFKLFGSGRAGAALGGAGDFNHDGLKDIIIGDFFSNNQAGFAYVVYGKPGSNRGSVGLNSLNPSDGFVILGAQYSNAGFSVSGGSDFNGDGVDDVLVGAMGYKGAEGATFVLYGRPGGYAQNISIQDITPLLGLAVFGMQGAELAWSAAMAGDINGDGVSDMIIGKGSMNTINPSFDPAYIIYGRKGGYSEHINLYNLQPSQGAKIIGDGFVGTAVSGTRDVNGDGLNDIIVGDPPCVDGCRGPGVSYVLYGQRGYWNDTYLGSLTSAQGFSIFGVADSNSGAAVGDAGDVNGDGLADILIGAFRYNQTATDQGAAYVIYGRKNQTNFYNGGD